MDTTRTRVTEFEAPTPNPPSHTVVWTKWDGSGNDPVVTDPAPAYTSTGSTGSDILTTHDVVTPNFKARSARGEIINNDFKSQRVTNYPPQPSYWLRSYVETQTDGDLYGSRYEGTYCCQESDLKDFLSGDIDLQPGWQSEFDSAVSAAVTEAHANASADEMQSLVTAAEAGKTVASLSSILRRAYKIVKAAKRLDFDYLAKQISRKELEQRYMELRYAIRPLMYDAKGLVSALDESDAYKRVRRTSRAFRHLTFTYTDTLEDGFDKYAGAVTGDIVRTVKHSVNIRAGVLSEVQTSGVNVWGLDQISQSMWELVPFSFIADWFFNIGNTISAWSPKAGVTELASWVTYDVVSEMTNKLVNTRQVWNASNNDVSNVFTHASEKRCVFKTKTRLRNPQLSVYPTVDVRLDPLKLLDLAIIGNKFRY